ncbi:MAG: hydrogenase maturation nickel metallochaperone HypA [Vicinamibacteria bacterium]
MHELDLSRAIIATVVKHAGGRRVVHVTLRIGRLRQVVRETLEFYLALVGRETPLEGATVEIVDVPAVLRCGRCEREWEIEIPAFVCPTCGPGAVAVVSGEEFMVESIEVQEAPRASSAAGAGAGEAP